MVCFFHENIVGNRHFFGLFDPEGSVQNASERNSCQIQKFLKEQLSDAEVLEGIVVRCRRSFVTGSYERKGRCPGITERKDL